MPQLSRGVSIGILSAIAVSLTCGAAQFALGRDLNVNPQDRLQQSMEDLATSGTAINRAAKTDRAAGVAGSAQTRTILLRPEGLPDTSVLVRIPMAQARPASSGPSLTKSPDHHKMAVACEPMVSVLSEVAKLLQPGRCVT
jgi:hypothetical protein